MISLLLAAALLAPTTKLPQSTALEFSLPTYVAKVKVSTTDAQGRTHFLFGRIVKVPVSRVCSGTHRDEDGTTYYDCTITSANPEQLYWIALYDSRGNPCLIPGEGKAVKRCEYGKKKWDCDVLALP